MTTPALVRHSRLVRLYAQALRLYPKGFHDAYATDMLMAFQDALSDHSLPLRELLSLIGGDLVVSLAKEHLHMLRDTFARPVLLFNAAMLAVLATGLALALNTIPQQVLRQGANDPQVSMATDLVQLLERGDMEEMLQRGALLAMGGTANLDMAKSLSPFLIVYNDQGQPLASQAQLNGQAPAPPPGVFDYVRKHGEERLSWQPVLGREHGVRIAAVIQRVTGPHPGFVLAGRNMREVEAREEQVRTLAGLTWIGMMGVILIGTLAFGWYSRRFAAKA
jgi:hypothetical protein